VPPRARIYLHCVIGTGLFLLLDGLSEFDSQDVRRFVAYFALALVSATWKFQVPSIKATFSGGFAFVLIGIADFSLPETLAMGCASIVVQTLWRSSCKRNMRKAFFNIAGVAFGVQLAYVPVHFARADGIQRSAVMLLLAALIYFVSNTALVAGMIALIEEAGFRPVWQRLAGYGLPYYVVGGLVSTVIIIVNRMLGWQAGIFILPFLYLTYTCYRAYLRSRGALRQA
jgi:MASE9 protein